MTGELAGLGAALCWAYNAVFFGKAGKRIGSFTVSHIRMWIALPFLILLQLLFAGAPLSLVSGSSWFYLGLSGFIGFFLGDILLFEAFVLLGPRLTMLIMSLAPVIGTALSRLMLNEKPSLLELIAIITATGAVGWVVSEKKKNENGIEEPHELKGLLFALGGALGQALGMVLSKMGMADGLSVITSNLIRAIFGLSAFFLFTLLTKRFLRDISKFFGDKRAALYTSTSTFIGPVLGVILALYAVKTIFVGVALTLTSLSPIILIPVAHFIDKEKITLRSLTGTLIALGAVSLFFFIN
ncbi:EamA family transporter [Candidatus Mcinerneyibacteriota bacterium]|nr:EamA family transporter [Candidatus Mcinerneyibacteriota bacterium]